LRERGRPLQGATVLLAEDNELNRIVAQGFLQRMGVNVRTAVDGAEAIEILRSEGASAIDAVLMDLQMPVLDGLEATRRIRAMPEFAALPIIGMTAAAMPADREQCAAAGMVDHVPKPVMPESLLEALLRWVARARQGGAQGTAIDLPGFDITALSVLMHGNETAIWSLLAKFADLEHGAAARVAALIASGDGAAACRKLHDLRGSAGTLGATEVARTALNLERALRQSEPAEAALAEFTSTLEGALAQLRAAIAGRHS
jgi:two-component system, sensor histidine kinase and response regulator